MEFWRLEIKCGNRNFEESFKNGILKINEQINKYNNNNNNENNNDQITKCEKQDFGN